jgi:hypothetical protein
MLKYNIQCVHKVHLGFWKIVACKQIELATCGLRQITAKLWKFFLIPFKFHYHQTNIQGVHKVHSGFRKIVARKLIELATCGLRQITAKLWKFFFFIPFKFHYHLTNIQCVHKVHSGFWTNVARKQIELATCGVQQITQCRAFCSEHQLTDLMNWRPDELWLVFVFRTELAILRCQCASSSSHKQARKQWGTGALKTKGRTSMTE